MPVRKSRLLSVGAFIFFGAVICFSHIHQGTLAVDAIRYASISQNMLNAGDPFYLYDSFEDRTYVNKPPLLFWLTALSFKFLGFSTFAAKFPAVFFAFIALVGIFFLVEKLHSETAAWWAVILTISNRSFQRDLLEFGFDGIAVCGALCCLSVMLRLATESQPLRVRSWLLFGVGLLLLLQSKPPYVAFVISPLVLWALIEKRFGELFFSRRFFLGVMPPLLLAFAWFAYAGLGYLMGALDNQVGEAVTMKRGFGENLLLWLEVSLTNLAPLSLLGVVGGVSLLRRADWSFARLSSMNRLLLVWIAMAIPIILFVAVRSRYLWVPLLGMVPIAGIYIQTLIPPIRPVHLRLFSLFVSAVVLLLVFVFNVRLHRQNPIVDLLDKHSAEVAKAEYLICVDGDREYRNQRMAKYTKVLLELRYGEKTEVYNSTNLPKNMSSEERFLVVENNCRNSLDRLGIRYDIVAEGYRSYLLKSSEI